MLNGEPLPQTLKECGICAIIEMVFHRERRILNMPGR